MLKDNLKKVDDLLNKRYLNEDLYMKIYSFTTENINGYINLFELYNKSLLTVGSSGDQVLNSYFMGANDITLLDINPFAKYYVNLKIAGIISLTYQEFQEFFFKWINNKYNLNRYNPYLYKKIKKNLKAIDYESYYFFKYIFKYYSKGAIISHLINDDSSESQVIMNINNYLKSEDNYNKLKKTLKNICFKFVNADIFTYQSNIKYDNIFLSNLCTVVNLYEYRDLLIKLRDNNLNINGSMLILYLWNIDYNSNEINFEWKQAYNMPGTKFLLKKFITEYYNITGIDDIKYNKDSKSDLVMIYKKKLN